MVRDRLDMTSGQHIDYDALALEALRGVVKACLAQVSRAGLVGEHHFYIAFNTQAPGVGMSKRLKEKYPVEMTIVLQHRFWDLLVDDERFEVKLTFDGIPERLVVPFSAVKVFYDPSVPYVLQFEEIDPATGAGPGATRRSPRRIGSANGPLGIREHDGRDDAPEGEKPERKRPSRRLRADPVLDAVPAREKPNVVPASVDHQSEAPQPVAPPAAAPVPAPGDKPAVHALGGADETGEEADDAKKDETPADPAGAKIFDISKFRGKK